MKLYLDVDGVINRFGAQALTTVEESEKLVTENGVITLADNVRKNLATLAETFEIIWATSWFEDAIKLGELLGVGSFNYLEWDQRKLEAIIKDAGDARWAWVDDDISWELENITLKSFLEENLLLEVDSTVGLTDAHTQILLKWAKTHK